MIKSKSVVNQEVKKIEKGDYKWDKWRIQVRRNEGNNGEIRRWKKKYDENIGWIKDEWCGWKSEGER